MMLLIFVAGLVAGGSAAFLIFSLCVISGRSEDRMIEGLRDMKQQVSYNEWHSSVFFPLSGVRLKKESAMFNK